METILLIISVLFFIVAEIFFNLWLKEKRTLTRITKILCGRKEE